MYAIIETGGKQYRVTENMKIRVEKMPVPEGEKVKLEKVLAFHDGKEIHIGTPFLPKTFVLAKALKYGKGKKVIVFRFKRRKDYKKKRGHRQPYLELLIEKIVRED